MQYNYENEREKIFTDAGQRNFLKVRDQAFKLLKEAGAFKMWPLLDVISGETSESMSYVDRLVELKEIREITTSKTAGQDRVFVKAWE